MCVCVCVCKILRWNIYIYIYITWLTWSSVSHLALLKFVRIRRLKANFNRLKIYFCAMGILRKSLLTTLTRLFISFGITSGDLALLNAQFMLDFLGLDLFASWLPIKFLSLLHVVIMRSAFCSIHKDMFCIFQKSNFLSISMRLELNSMFQEIFVTTQHQGIQNCSILPSLSIWMS